MSRKRSRADATPRGPIPLPEQAPIYGRNPLGMPLSLPRGWIMRPIWKTAAGQTLLVVAVAAPLAILASAIVIVAIQALLSR